MQHNPPVFPLRPSANGRYLIDRDGQPFLLHADTGWRMVNRLALPEVDYYLFDRRARGFNAIHMHAINKELEGYRNPDGHAPFSPDTDMRHPHEPYWRHVDAVMRAATEMGFLLVVSAAWLGWQGADWRPELTPAAARAYGRFLGQRYRGFDNILWVLGGDNDPGDRIEAIRALGAAIKEEAPQHLITVHNHQENPSAIFFDGDDWLDVNMVYTYLEAAAPVYNEYARAVRRVRPIILGETGYEDESNTGFPWTPALVRRQVYWALLSGAAGHAYGSKTVWNFQPGWRDALDKPAANQMRHAYDLFACRPWWRLVPDRAAALVTDGRGTFGRSSYVAAARADDGSFALAYLPSPRPITVALDQVAAGNAQAWWYNPRDGTMRPARGVAGAASGARVYTPLSSEPEDDWVLLLQG